MSDSRNDANEVLRVVIGKLDHLNLRDRVFDIEPLKCKFGASSDVHRAKLRKYDGSVMEVAVKRVRASMIDDPVFAKVKCKFRGRDSSNVFLELCKRNECLGEAFARECHGIGGLHYGEWTSCSRVHMVDRRDSN